MRKSAWQIILVGIAFFLTQNGFSQNPYPVYDAVLKRLTEHKKVSFFLISDHTTTRDLQEVNVRNPEQHVLNPSQLKNIRTPEWQSFLDTIQVDTLTRMKLDHRFKSRVRFVSEVRDYYHKGDTSPWRLPRNKYRNVYGIVWLSPVIFSSDFTRAICTLNTFQNPDSASSMLFFLEKRGSSPWQLVDRILLSIS